MVHALAALVLAAAPAKAPAVTLEGGPAPEARAVVEPADVARLCAALVPVERLRGTGDALARGEAEASHDRDRDAWLSGRYSSRVPAGKLAFAPYDAGEQRLALAEPVVLPVAGGAGRLWPTLDRGLPVDADPATARRVLDAQRAGHLSLDLVWALPDDGVCGGTKRGFTVPMEPVAWAWLDGSEVLARGGEGSDHPLVSAARGAVPRVEVGEPLAGPPEARALVAGRAADLLACYATALRRDPALDGVLVADLGGDRAAIRADSIGDADLVACVRDALGAIARGAGKAAVPIRFELAPPAPPRPADPAGEGR